ncbi:MAG: hypothetical protein A3K19_18635 [Lentisphaerae bacterium RIFOXYB12_FULL_65_16]|nr:MAG: hypothetical protein A3K18_00965 [Lentisphaerae bacterium RIFOXYA12_64_32]OGV92363.1 MAG: hypothetical protein A3K19_18635 [Lentisphaerae bacterium RIFOXYB12_FULL_65_16]
MKALLTNNKGRLWLADVTVPAIGDYECLVKMEACLFCHTTDQHIVDGTFVCGFQDPSILGHESVGIVEKTGAKVRHLKPGDRVLRVYSVYPGQKHDDCGSAWGGFAEYGKVTDWQAMLDDGKLEGGKVPMPYMQKVPADIPFEKSLLMIPMKEIYSASRKVGEIKGRSFLVAGAGVTGCMFGMFLKADGAARVTLAARRRDPLEFALRHKVADDTLLLDGTSQPATYDTLIDTTGSMETMRKLADSALKPAGQVCSYAVYDGMSKPGFFDGLAAQHKFQRIDPAEATAHDAVCERLRNGSIDASPFLTARFGINDWEKAWASVRNRTSLKTAIMFG